MTQFLLVVFITFSNGTVFVGAQTVTGADLCLSRADAKIAELKRSAAPEDQWSVKCVDSGLVLRIGDPA